MDIQSSYDPRSKLNKPGIARTAAENKALEAARAKESQGSSSSGNPSQWQEGQVLRGQILDHRYNEVKLRLEPDKQVISARISGNVPLSIGENAKFQVTGESPGHRDGSERLTLKYIPETSSPVDPTVQKALTASGFPMTDRNKQIVEELLRHTLPVDKQTLQTMIQLSHTYRDATPLTLVLMYKNNIPINGGNVNQFQAYQNGTAQLIEDIRQTVKGLTELFLPEDSSFAGPELQAGSQSSSVHEQLFLPSSPAEGLLPSQSGLTAEEALTQSLGINRALTELLYGTAPGSASLPADTLLAQIYGRDALLQLAKELQTSLLPEQLGSMTLEEASMSPSSIPEVPPSSMPEMISDLLAKYNSASPHGLPAHASVSRYLDASQSASLAELLDHTPGSEAMAERLADGSASVRDLLIHLQDRLPDMNQKTAARLLSSPEYQKLLEGAFLDRWTLTPNKLAGKTAAKELYQQLSEDMERLASITASKKPAGENGISQEPAKQLQEHLRFMKDLNEAFTYLQLPVQLKDQTVHSELYVYTRKKALQSKENLSVLLHLDMPHLGAMNILIRMDHNTVHASFRLEDKSSHGILSESLSSLTKALAQKGYQLQSEITDEYKKVDFSRDFIEEGAGEGEVKRYSFDIRT